MFKTMLKEFSCSFVRDTRDDGSVYYRFKDGVNDAGVPSWLADQETQTSIMRDVHDAVDGRFPDDWIYEHTMRVAQSLAEYEPDDADAAREHTHEVADGLVDVYNHDRLQWLASHLGNVTLCDEAADELGATDADIITRIGYGQFRALECIASGLINALESLADERASESEDEICDECEHVSVAHADSCSLHPSNLVNP